MRRSRAVVLAACAALLTLEPRSDVLAYGLWQSGAGRADFEAAGRYDLNGFPWIAPAGSPTIYDFGNVSIAGDFLTGLNLNRDVVNAAVRSAGDAWEPWANIRIGDDTSGDPAAARIRLQFDANASGAATNSIGAGQRSFAEVVFGPTVNNVPWTAGNLAWTLMHEFGHVIGLDDLYLNYVEEFIDHPIAGAHLPDLREQGCQDNVMDRINSANMHGNCTNLAVNDYNQPATTFVDNDEIAAAAWLWGSPYDQIVTGRLDDTWNGAPQGRNTLPHHGDQTGGWWMYRGTFGTPADEPCIDIEFPGFSGDYALQTFPHAPIRYDGPQGFDFQRFCIEAADWVGNFELTMRSLYWREGYIDAVLSNEFGVGRVDRFVLPPDADGLTFVALDDRRALWPMLFGPASVPEPGVLWLLGSAVFAAAFHARPGRCRIARL